LFQRIAILKKNDDELLSYLQFELAPFPLALFDEHGLRKTKKSSLYDILQPIPLESINITNAKYVIDGGFLLHRVIWQMRQTFELICESYITYVEKHFGTDVNIVFDGYENNAKSIKSSERQRRRLHKKCSDVFFESHMIVPVSKENFLSNDKNKMRFIELLKIKLIHHRFIVKIANDDADTLIVILLINVSSYHPKSILVGEDIDLLVLLIALTPRENNIYFLKPISGKIEKKMYSTEYIQKHNHSMINKILFYHALSGCDTTSALFQKGKKNAYKY